MNYLADHGIISYKWQESVGSKLFKKIREKADMVFNFYSSTKEFMKIKLIKEILEKQTLYQEDTLSKIINKGTDWEKDSPKSKLAKDAVVILNELSGQDLDISNTSIEEASFYENYNDPEFQSLLMTLKRMCKRERMLITILNNRISEIEEDKIKAEETLADFMQKSSVNLLNTSTNEEFGFEKQFHQTVNNIKDPHFLEMTVRINNYA